MSTSKREYARPSRVNVLHQQAPFSFLASDQGVRPL